MNLQMSGRSRDRSFLPERLSMKNLVTFAVTLLLARSAVGQVKSVAPVPSGIPRTQLQAPDLVKPLSKTLAIGGGGIDGSGGGSLRPEAGSAWFLGEKKAISYCVVSSETFGTNVPQLQTMIENVFRQWQSYMTDKNISGIASRLTRLSACSGAEDLKFYFGVDTSGIVQERLHYDQPVALNIRTRYDLDRGWGKGLIWIAEPESIAKGHPDFKNERRLYGILLHEVGHVFGNGHVEDTVMTEHIDQNMHGDRAESVRLNMIDQNRELSHCTSCQKTYKGGVAQSRGSSDSANGENAEQKVVREFEFLTGEKPNGVPTQELQVENTTYLNKAILVFRDQKKAWQFPIQLVDQQCPRGSGSVSVFKQTYRTNDGKISTYQGDARECVYKGVVTTARNNAFAVSIDLNMNSEVQSYLVVSYTEPKDFSEHTLFTLPFINRD